jgi:outer membrane protein
MMLITKKDGWRIPSKIKKYEAEAATVTEAINGDRSKVQDMQKNCWFQRQCSKKLQQKNLICKTIGKSKSFYPKVGKTKDSNMFLMVLFYLDGPNLTMDVKKDLGF